MSRLALDTGSVTDTIRVGNAPSGVAVGEGSVWVTNAGDSSVSRIDPETNEVSQTLPASEPGPTGIAVGDGALWVADSIGAALLRVDPTTEEESQSVPLAGQPSGVAFTPDGVWVSYRAERRRARRPVDVSVTLTQRVGSGPTAVVVGVRIDLGREPPRRHGHAARALDRTGPGDDPGRTGPERARGGVAGPLWVGNEFDDTIAAIDPDTNDVEQTVPVGGAAASLATDEDGLWLAVGASAAEHRGGTLTVSSEHRTPKSLDPAIVVFNDTLAGARS